MSSLTSFDAGNLPTPSTTTSARKRVLSDSEDTESRDVKRSRPTDLANDKGKQKDPKDKKRRRKKKRKTSIVQPAHDSDEDSPVLAPKPLSARAKSMSVGVSELKPAALSQPVKQEEGLAESMRQPSAGPSAPPTTRLPSSTVENAEDTVVRS